MTATRARKKFVLLMAAVVLMALMLRLYYAFAAQIDNPFRADAGQYFRIAINIIEHGTVSVADSFHGIPRPDSYRAPGYPLLIALPLVLTHSSSTTYGLILLGQAILGALVAWLTMLIARRWLDPGYAVAAGMLVALSPHLISQGDYILTESVFGAGVTLAAYLSIRALESRRNSTAAAAGAAFAAAAMVNQMIVLFPLLFAAFAVRRLRIYGTALFLVTALVPPVLWAVRDASIQPPVLYSSGERLFENMVIWTQPDLVRYYRNPADPRGIAARKRIFGFKKQYARNKMSAYENLFAELERRPGHFLVLAAKKPFDLWSWSVQQGAGDVFVYPMLHSPFDGNPLYRTIAALFHGLNPILMLAAFVEVVVVLVAAVRKRLPSTSFALLVGALTFGYATAVYTALTPDVRYANPFRQFEMLLAVGLVADAVAWIRSKREREKRAVDPVPAPD